MLVGIRRHHGWAWPSSLSRCLQERKAKGTAIFFGGLPGAERVLHINPGNTLDQFRELGRQMGGTAVTHCFFMAGHKVWSVWSASDVGTGRGSRVKIHARLLGESAFQCWICPKCRMDKRWPARMSCFRCGCPRPRDGGAPGGGGAERVGVWLVENSPFRARNRLWCSMRVVVFSQEPRTREHLQQRVRATTAPRPCCRCRHKRWRPSRICLGLRPEVTGQLRAQLSQ